MLFSAYFVKNYIHYLYAKKHDCIMSLLYILNEYSETNGSNIYSSLIYNVEEMLYHIEKMINNFTFTLAKYLLNSFSGLLDKYDPKIQLVNNKTNKKKMVWNEALYLNHFLIWSPNPVKLCVLIIYICQSLGDRLGDLNIQHVTESYSKIANMIIDECSSQFEVEEMLTDKCLNGYEVIDLLGYQKIESILNNETVGLIIGDFWGGPYYRELALTSSTTFQIVAPSIIR